MGTKTACDYFYYVSDVMAMTNYSKSKSYKIIAQLNRELEEQGYMTFDGRVPRKYFERRTGIELADVYQGAAGKQQKTAATKRAAATNRRRNAP